MSKEIDTNIDNYSRQELLEILGVDTQEEDTNLIESKINQIIKKFKSENNNKFTKFFLDAKKILTEKPEKKKVPQAEIWLRNQFLKQTDKSQSDKTTKRENQVGFFENSTHPVMLRNQLGVSNTIPLEIAQGNLNPNLKQKIIRKVVINSSFRNNIIPYSSDPRDPTSPTNFTCTLSIPLRNVLKMSLSSIFIPTTFNVFDDVNSNTIFWIKNISNDSNDSNELFPVQINNGTYNLVQLKEELNNALETANFSDISVSLSGGSVSNRIFFNNSGSDEYEVHFLNQSGINNIMNSNTDSLDSNSCNISNLSNLNYSSCLGNYLGFRFSKEDAKESEDSLIGKIPEKFYRKLTATGLIADVRPNLTGSKYFNLLVDDFNNNHAANRLITIGNLEDRLSLPTYFNHSDLSGCYMINEQTIPQALPTFPRKLTQNQLFSINNIIQSRQRKNNRLSDVNSPNILSCIQLPDIFGFSDASGNKILKESISINTFESDINERNYFGPVTIHRLKISLVDYLGNLVNLNGHDWSFTLKVEELYEY